MKSLLLIGGLLGFGIGFAFSWMEENGWPSMLWHSCLSAYVTGLLFRWWGRAWVRGLDSAISERRMHGATARFAPANKTTKS
jgi:hypothetical protein